MIDLHAVGHHSYLRELAHRAMLERGLLPDFQPEDLAELDSIHGPALQRDAGVRDLRGLLWCSIDNNDSRDLDQLTVAEKLPDGRVKVLIAVADVDSLVKPHSALDKHANHNTSSVYTVAEVFPMLPERLCTDLTSLNHESDRLAIVIELLIGLDGAVQESTLYRALVRNLAKLSYSHVARWLEGSDEVPREIANVRGLEENLLLQDSIAQKLKLLRHERGALEFETIHASPVFENDILKDLVTDRSNRAKDIVADFMIAANGAVARFLTAKGFPSIRRVVHTPRRWDRIVALAEEHGHKLPSTPEPRALNEFLMAEKAADPIRFPDISLSVIKLLGSGEYSIELPGVDSEGHFGLAVKDYTHSTAPNRRFPDLLTQRLVKSALEGSHVPYSNEELTALALHCSKTEDAVNKVERQVSKSAAALLLRSRIGEEFKGIVTGSAPKGTWIRLFKIPVEGRLVKGFEGLDVGQKLRVRLVHTDVEQGFIDFERIG